VIGRRPTTIAFRVMAVSVALALVVAVALTTLLLAVSQLRHAVAREARSKDTVAAVLTLQNATSDLESSLRGYLLTANARFLRPWQLSLRNQQPAQTQLDRLTATDPTLHRDVRDLDAQIADYVRDYALPLIAIAQIDPEVARSRTAADEGKLRTDDLRRRFRNLIASENARTARRSAAVRHASRTATAASVAAIGFSGLLILGLGAVGARALRQRLRRAAEAAAEIAGGELSARVPEGGAVELAELGRAFNQMAEALAENRRTLLEQNRILQENERRKTELIMVVSHELRTPLAGLLGFTSLLLERELDPAAQRRYLRIVHDESRRLSELVDRFLDVGAVEDEAFELHLEPVDVSRLLREQSELMVSDTSRHVLVLNLPAQPLWAMADRDRLTEVVSNLVANAVKYSPEGGAVEVVAAATDDVLRVEVIDHGLGIDEEDQPQVFTKFFRGRAAEIGIPGTGLGLAVAREIVEAHGGSIGFESIPGSGSTFWIELTPAPPESRSSATAA
jgi:signal transduction histidine kinase